MATFISNHDIGRAGYALRQALPGASDAELVQRMTWGYAMLYFARGFPVVYYGDEQGFVGGGSDKLSREDMMPSLVPDYMNNDLIGTAATPADANFDATHPLYQALAELAQVRADHVALRRGAQIHRYSTDGPGIYAFSRIERDEQIEYVVAFNSATSAKQATFPVYLADTQYLAVYPAGGAALPQQRQQPVDGGPAGRRRGRLQGRNGAARPAQPRPASRSTPRPPALKSTAASR